MNKHIQNYNKITNNRVFLTEHVRFLFINNILYLPEAPSGLTFINNSIFVSSDSTMETAFGTLRASISRVSVGQRNASTRPRPSPWSRADWLDWRVAPNQEPTAG